MVMFTNCDSYQTQDSSSDNDSVDNGASAEGFVDADYLKESQPDILCGQEGYKYLIKEYFGVHCSVCHQKGGDFQPYFADNVEYANSYYAALYIDETTFLKTITENRFCGKECSLNNEGETYKAIVEWLENKWVCP